MELSWIATCVAAAAGLGGTVYVARTGDRREARQAAEQRAVVQARLAEDARREERDSQRPAVTRLNKAFIGARQSARSNPETFEGGADMFSEFFPEHWEKTYYSCMEDAEVISDVRVRTAVLDCLQTIQWSGGLENQFGWGTARQIVARAGATGFRITGGWIRGEPISDDLLRSAAEVSEILRAYDQFWTEQQDPRKSPNSPDLLDSPRPVVPRLPAERNPE